jgi:hypothetical protein
LKCALAALAGAAMNSTTSGTNSRMSSRLIGIRSSCSGRERWLEG